MDPEKAPVPEFLAKAEDENSAVGQQLRSVTWNLDSPTAGAVAPQATTSPGTYPASAFFRHSRLGNRRDTHVGSQPKICFLRPRTAQPLVFFRCGAGTQSVRQSSDPGKPSSQTSAPSAAAGILVLALQNLGRLRAGAFLRPQESLNVPVQVFTLSGARTPSARTLKIPTSTQYPPNARARPLVSQA